jgi:hypothetical protein
MTNLQITKEWSHAARVAALISRRRKMKLDEEQDAIHLIAEHDIRRRREMDERAAARKRRDEEAMELEANLHVFTPKFKDNYEAHRTMYPAKHFSRV